jgi:putative restriction endonuclease
MPDRDALIRMVAFAYVDRLSQHGERPLTWAELNAFTYDGVRMPLVSQQGIFKPAMLALPISIRTTFREPGQERPYQDEVDENGYLMYRYRGVDPSHHENRWLRRMQEEAISLLYFVGVAKGMYQVHAAAIIEDHPESLTFGVQLFPIDAASIGAATALELDVGSRRHYMALVRRRAGQAVFREAVLNAYGSRCTLCRLGHRELLDAAHIVPDSEGGPSVIPNGLSMCKIHHAAYDADIIGVRPDHIAEVRADVLTEIDGPMLRHGLQELHGTTIHLPRVPGNRPSHDALERRYERFRNLS